LSDRVLLSDVDQAAILLLRHRQRVKEGLHRRFAAELATAVGQHAQELGIVLLEERQHSVVQEIGGGDRRVAVIELGEGGSADRCARPPFRLPT
jgi:hypothetical protein